MIENTSKRTLISQESQIYQSFLLKSVGLMFSRPKTIIFLFKKEQKQHLHMIFVFCPIDLIFLNDKKEVVEIKENFRPFTFYSSQKKAQYVIECPAGTVKKSKTSVGDKVKF